MDTAAQAPGLGHGDVEDTRAGPTALAPSGPWPSEVPVPVVKPEARIGVTSSITQADEDASAPGTRKPRPDTLAVPVDVGPLAEVADTVASGGDEARRLETPALPPDGAPPAKATATTALTGRPTGLRRPGTASEPPPSARPAPVVGTSIAEAAPGAA